MFLAQQQPPDPLQATVGLVVLLTIAVCFVLFVVIVIVLIVRRLGRTSPEPQPWQPYGPQVLEPQYTPDALPVGDTPGSACEPTDSSSPSSAAAPTARPRRSGS